MKNSVIGKTFSYRGIGNIVFIMTITGFENEGERFDSDRYIGKETLIFPNGESMEKDWSCDKRFFESNLKSGKYKRLR